MSIRAYNEREKRGDRRAGVIASTLINVNRDPKKHSRVKPEDLFPSLKPERPRREQSPEEMRRLMLAMAALTGGKVQQVPREQYEAMTRGA